MASSTGPQNTGEYRSAPTSTAVPLELLRSPPPRERTDAARNRGKILAAARRLIAEHGIDGVSMDAVAATAGVGKGTLFRRFGDRSGLAAALLDDAERTLQEQILYGPPPLGPGADPGERLLAFGDAYLDYVIGHLDLLRVSETAAPGARYRIGAYRFWHRHVAILLAESGTVPAETVEYLAHAVLAPLAADLMTAVIPETGIDRAREGVRTLVTSLLSPPCTHPG